MADDFTNFNTLNQRVAYHEAGHATAIYLYNKYKNLPPIFFQVCIETNLQKQLNNSDNFNQNHIAAKIEGGYLIENPLLSLSTNQAQMSLQAKKSYAMALDADVINLLAGSVAEAYYLSTHDGETLTASMLTVEALENYGAYSDFQKINTYLSYVSPCIKQQTQHLNKLLHETFNFMTQPKLWLAVESVAKLFLSTENNIIACEEIFAVIDAQT